MKRHLLFLAIAFIGMTFNSCVIHIDGETMKGDGNVVAREYAIDHFDVLVCALPATVNYSVADQSTCTVRVDENLFEYIDIKEKDGELVLRQAKPKGGKYINYDATEFVINITAPSVDEIMIAGSGDLNILSPIHEQSLEVNIAGSGNVVFKEEVDINHLELSVAGSGDIRVDKGTIRELEADIAGSGDIVSHAETQKAEATVMGSGDITVNVTGRLEYRIVGSGDIYYYGGPEVSGKIAGSGSIESIEKPSRQSNDE